VPKPTHITASIQYFSAGRSTCSALQPGSQEDESESFDDVRRYVALHHTGVLVIRQISRENRKIKIEET
jgi:hypothetical protein